MSTTIEELLRRVEQLEAEVARLKAEKEPRKDWRRTLGMFTGDEVMKEINDEALRIREAEREAARRDPQVEERTREPRPYDWERSLGIARRRGMIPTIIGASRDKRS
jgi:hypothetical protein